MGGNAWPLPSREGQTDRGTDGQRDGHCQTPAAPERLCKPHLEHIWGWVGTGTWGQRHSRERRGQLISVLRGPRSLRVPRPRAASSPSEQAGAACTTHGPASPGQGSSWSAPCSWRAGAAPRAGIQPLDGSVTSGQVGQHLPQPLPSQLRAAARCWSFQIEMPVGCAPTSEGLAVLHPGAWALPQLPARPPSPRHPPGEPGNGRRRLLGPGTSRLGRFPYSTPRLARVRRCSSTTSCPGKRRARC